jgi:hypothetical protein
MPPEGIIIEVLDEIEGIGPVTILEIDPARNSVTYRTIMPVHTLLPNGEQKVCATGFDFSMN